MQGDRIAVNLVQGPDSSWDVKLYRGDQCVEHWPGFHLPTALREAVRQVAPLTALELGHDPVELIKYLTVRVQVGKQAHA